MSRKLKTGIFIFTLITIASLVLIYAFSPSGDGVSNLHRVYQALMQMKPIYLIWTTFIILISIALSAYRRQLLTKGVDNKLRFIPAMSVVMGYEFVSAITPFGSGGQPLEVWILKKNGISLGKGIVVTYMNTVSMIIVLFFFGPLALLFYPSLIHGYTIPTFLTYGMIFLSYFVTLTLFSIFKPKSTKRIAFRLLKLAKRIRIIKPHKFYKILKHVIYEVNIFSKYLKNYFSGRILLFFYILLITSVTYIVRWLSVFTIGLAFGIYISPIKLIFAQMFILFANYSIPTPGASGTSEILALSIFAKLVPGYELVIMTLWRFFTFHLIFLISMIPSLKVIQMKQKELPQFAEEIPHKKP